MAQFASLPNKAHCDTARPTWKGTPTGQHLVRQAANTCSCRFCSTVHVLRWNLEGLKVLHLASDSTWYIDSKPATAGHGWNLRVCLFQATSRTLWCQSASASPSQLRAAPHVPGSASYVNRPRPQSTFWLFVSLEAQFLWPRLFSGPFRTNVQFEAKNSGGRQG